MTYIIGVHSHGTNSIISDARISVESDEHSTKGFNISLKTGLFFPGCIFGQAGNAGYSRDFILAAKYGLKQRNTIQGFWEDFIRFVSLYSFDRREESAFQLLLSSRATGQPRFYLLDSRTGLGTVKENFITIGSGKTILDDKVLGGSFAQILIEVQKALEDNPAQGLLSPYLICLRLTELSQSFERKQLESKGVGGVFHFLYQTGETDKQQHPAYYVLNSINVDKKQVVSWCYRVCFVNYCLAVETLTPPLQLRDYPHGRRETEVFLNETALPPLEDGLWDTNATQQLVKDIESELEKQPLYFFCGFGYTNPSYRKGYLIHATTQEDYVINDDGIHPEYLKIIINQALSSSNSST